MRKIIMNGVITFAVTLLAPQILQAQGTMTYLSNLGQASGGSLAVGSDSWLAVGVLTGPNAGGYVLDSIQLGMTDASGNPNGFTVMLYSETDIVAVVPGSNLGTLNGSLNPTTAGIYTYTPASSLTLSPSTGYFIVLTAGTTVANGAYEWSYVNTSSYNPSDSWLGRVALGSSNGSVDSWGPLGDYPPGSFSQYAINATAVPEPGVFGLLGLGGLLLAWHRRKATAV
jgi:hypothetical protein